MTFDPTKFGATPVAQNTQGFNASKFGASAFPTEEPESVKRNFLQKTAGLLGIEKAGQGLATAGRVVSGAINQTGNEEGALAQQQSQLVQALHDPRITPEQKAHLIEQMKRQNLGAVTQTSIDPGTQLSNREVMGSFGNLATNIIGAGSLPAEGASSFGLSKGGEALLGSTAKTVGKRLAETTAKNAAFGAVNGITQGLNDNKSLGDTTKTALQSLALQGGIGFGAQSLSEIGKLLTSRQVTEGIIDKSIGTSKKIIKAGKSPAADIINNGQIKSKAGLLEAAHKTIDNSEEKIASILKNSNTQRYDTAPILDTIKKTLTDTYQGALNKQEIDQIVEGLPVAALRDGTSMNAEGINNLRKVIDSKYIGDAKWLNSGAATPERITALKAAANSLRSIVQDSHPDLPGIFKDYSKAITQKTVLQDELAKPHVLTNILEALGAAGVTMGGGVSPSGIAHGLGTFAAIKTLLSTPVQTGLAIGLDRAGKIPATKVGQGARTLGRLAAQRTVQAVNK